jgi:hypothetical protein
MTDLWNIRGVSEERRRQAKSAAAACGMTLGAWVSAMIEKIAPIGKDSFRIVFTPPEEEILIPPGPDIEPRKKPREVKRCAHGKSKGDNCWQCGGLAVVEEK